MAPKTAEKVALARERSLSIVIDTIAINMVENGYAGNVQARQEPAFVEIFCGNAHLAKAARDNHNLANVMSVDMDKKLWKPTIVADINNPAHRQVIKKQLKNWTKEGRLILIHMSPPCNAFSVCNTTGKNKPLIWKNGVDTLMAGKHIADQYGAMWSLENPRTGSLWSRVDMFPHTRNVDYCAYGSNLRKATRIAFNCEQLQNKFAHHAKLCPYDERDANGKRGKCPQMEYVKATKTYRHKVHFDNVKYQDRVAIPQPLADNLVSSMILMHDEIVDRVITKANEIYAEENPVLAKKIRRLNVPHDIPVIPDLPILPAIPMIPVLPDLMPAIPVIPEEGQENLDEEKSYDYENDYDNYGNYRHYQYCVDDVIPSTPQDDDGEIGDVIPGTPQESEEMLEEIKKNGANGANEANEALPNNQQNDEVEKYENGENTNQEIALEMDLVWEDEAN